MAITKRASDFFETDEGVEFMHKLSQMTEDEQYDTKDTYSANSTLHPDNLISFVEKHKNYLRTHPSINPQYYLSNLRLITRKR